MTRRFGLCLGLAANSALLGGPVRTKIQNRLNQGSFLGLLFLSSSRANRAFERFPKYKAQAQNNTIFRSTSFQKNSPIGPLKASQNGEFFLAHSTRSQFQQS